MPVFKNKLDELLADAVLASGNGRTVAIEVVREYMRNTPLDKQRQDISQISSLQELNMLQAAGVPQGLQGIFLDQFLKYSAK